MSEHDFHSQLNRHYTPTNLAEAILKGLSEAGKDPERFSYDDLAPVDQFHTLGKPATLELAQLAKITPGMSVLDVGGGLGGPARTLAAEFGCLVTVLDMTEEYCRVGEMLTQRAGLGGRVQFRHGNALAMPFADASFDLVWTQHCNMNIADKEQLCSEIRRVLRPGGRLAIHEIAAGPNQPVHFPVPWASEPGLSFLRPVAEIRALIERHGFEEIAFQDMTAHAVSWFRERATAAPTATPPLGLHLLLGKNFKPAFANQVRNLEENRVAVIKAVFRKP